MDDLMEVIASRFFPEVDARLRRGYHLSSDDGKGWFAFVQESYQPLHEFYRRYGMNLVVVRDGYAYLDNQGAVYGKHTLTLPEMLVGQALTIVRLTPSALRSSGRYHVESLFSAVAQLTGQQGLSRLLHYKARPKTPEELIRKAQEAIRTALGELDRLGFVAFDNASDEFETFRCSNRFVEHVGNPEYDPEACISQLVEEGRAAYLDAEDADLPQDGTSDKVENPEEAE